ncbi:MAG: holo-ACP synthase [Bacteroidota bacterium]
MLIATGVDLIEIERVEQAIARHGDRFLKRVFTPAELQACGGRAQSLAARFAAKEAAAKALGRGIGDVGWREIEVVGNENNAPALRLHGEAQRLAAEQGLLDWSVSLSHSREQAVAVVVAVGISRL